MRSSNPINTELNIIGRMPAATPATPSETIPTLNPAKTFNIMWPAIMFANKRTDKVTGRTKNDKISIGKIIGINHHGTPGGRNKLKK